MLEDKLLVTLSGEIKTPPMTSKARTESGYLLRRLQQGEALSLPQSRPLPKIGPRCHELRIPDKKVSWRIVYRVDRDAIVVVEVFPKKTGTIPDRIIEICKKRLSHYDSSY